jgi:tetratricopeptide (TPR) repeat protein
VLDLGVRADAEARDLRRGAELLERGRREEAAALFARHESLEAKLGTAFARWPGTLERVEQLGALYPRSAVAQLHVGLARFWAGRAGAEEAWREARDAEPDTPYAVRASSLLHREFAPGLPLFVAAEPFPAELRRLPPAEQLERLRELSQAPFDSRVGLVHKLHYGIALQRLGRPLSARRVYDEAARAFPNDPEALVAAAVVRFEKERPEAAFSRLGPLARRFPQASTVRFHLGLLLLWSSRVDAARAQLRRAERAEPGSRLAAEATRYLRELEQAGTD